MRLVRDRQEFGAFGHDFRTYRTLFLPGGPAKRTLTIAPSRCATTSDPPAWYLDAAPPAETRARAAYLNSPAWSLARTRRPFCRWHRRTPPSEPRFEWV